jgi:hypothetical protein
LTLPGVGLEPSSWLCVAGAGSKTRVALKLKRDADGPYFWLTSADRANMWDDPPPADPYRTGDGTVPLRSALPKFLDERAVVCVTPDDFGYFEVTDRLTSSVAGFHGILPNMDMVHRLIARHFTGSADPKENTWGRPLPDVSNVAWRPPVWPLRNERK